MPNATEPPRSKAIRYAEDNLGIHVIYDEAKAARDRIATLGEELIVARDAKRFTEEAMKDREIDLASEACGEHPDFSATKMEGHLKGVRHADDSHRQFREGLSRSSRRIDELEHAIRLAEIDVKVTVARMGELGGYLTFLAVVKEAEISRIKQREAGDAE